MAMPCRSGTQIPQRLNCFFRAGNNDCVETEEKSGECGRERPKKDATIHELRKYLYLSALLCVVNRLSHFWATRY